MEGNSRSKLRNQIHFQQRAYKSQGKSPRVHIFKKSGARFTSRDCNTDLSLGAGLGGFHLPLL